MFDSTAAGLDEEFLTCARVQALLDRRLADAPLADRRRPRLVPLSSLLILRDLFGAPPGSTTADTDATDPETDGEAAGEAAVAAPASTEDDDSSETSRTDAVAEASDARASDDEVRAAADEARTAADEARTAADDQRTVRRLLAEGAAHLEAAATTVRERDLLSADEARHLVAYLDTRPGRLLDRPEGTLGAAAAATRAAQPAVLEGISEWAIDEVAARYHVTSGHAESLLVTAATLVRNLPDTLASVEDGRISWPAAAVLADKLGPLDAEPRAEVERRVLARASGKDLTQLRAAIRRTILRVDAEGAARRAVAAVRDRGVRHRTGDDGLDSLDVRLPRVLARSVWAALHAYAEEAKVPGDERTLQQRMADCLVDLVLRPGSRSAVRADVTLTVPVGTVLGGNEPGEIDGQVIDAVTVRETCYALGLLPRPAAGGHVPDRGDPAAPDPADTERPGREHAAPRESEAAEGPDDGSGGPPPAEAGEAVVGEPGTSLSDAERQRREDLGRWILGSFRATGDAAAEEAGRPPRIALVDELTGQLLALTGGRELLRAAACGRPACRRRPHRCTHTDHLVDPVTGVPTGRRSGIGPPPPTDGYRPGAALDRFVRARDRHCRFPGCRRRAGTDLDHTIPWPAGPTCCENLAALCRHHHRLSHQAPGWRLDATGDGGLRWTLPGGHTRVTHPPAYGSDDDQPPDPMRDAGVPIDAGPPVDTPRPADTAPPASDEAAPF